MLEFSDEGLLHRRRFLAQLAALTLLPGCSRLVKCTRDTCPPDIARDCGGLAWMPDVVHPVAWGVHALTREDGAPRDMLIYYPSCRLGVTTARDPRLRDLGYTPPFNRSTAAPVYKLNNTAWPLLLFLHGNMPRQPSFGAAHDASHRMWTRLASTVARCGFVVVVPRHEASAHPTAEEVNLARRDVDWVRYEWSESASVAKTPAFTAVGGHSNGALLAAKMAVVHPDFAAYVSLGGHHADGNAEAGEYQTLRNVTIPSFLMWTPSNTRENLIIGAGGYWTPLTQAKYGVVYDGTHFDYLEPSDAGTLPLGPCREIAGTAAELVTLFLAQVISSQVPGAVQIPIGLPRPGGIQSTSAQAIYADGLFASLGRIDTQTGCRIDVHYDIDGLTGHYRLGP